MELLLFGILLLHALTNPYEEKWHNSIDILLLTVLLIVNTLTIFNYFTALSGTIESGISTDSVVQIQAFLLCLPLVYLCSYVTYRCYRVYKPLHKKRGDSVESAFIVSFDNDGLDGFPARLLQEEGSLSTLHSRSVNRSYQTFRNWWLVDSFACRCRCVFFIQCHKYYTFVLILIVLVLTVWCYYLNSIVPNLFCLLKECLCSRECCTFMFKSVV